MIIVDLQFLSGNYQDQGKNDDSLPILKDKDKNLLIYKLKDVAISLNLQISINSNNNEIPIYYAASFNQYLRRSNGTVGKCSVVLYDTKNIIGKIDENGILYIDKNKLIFWLRG